MPSKRRVTPKRHPPSSTDVGRVAILLEEIKAQNRATIEAVYATAAELRGEFAERCSRIEARLDVLELAVRKNSEDIKKNSEDIKRNSEDIKRNSEDIKKNSEDIKKNSEDIAELRSELAGVRRLLDRSAEERAFQDLERRVSVLEDRAGIRGG